MKLALAFIGRMALAPIAQAKTPTCPRHKHLNSHHRCVPNAVANECPYGYYLATANLCCADGAVYVGHNRCEFEGIPGPRPSTGGDDGDSTTTPGTVCTGGECNCSNGTVTTPGSVCP